MPKGAAITLSATVDPQQSNPMHYKATDETAKFEQVRTDSKGSRSDYEPGHMAGQQLQQPQDHPCIVPTHRLHTRQHSDSVAAAATEQHSVWQQLP